MSDAVRRGPTRPDEAPLAIVRNDHCWTIKELIILFALVDDDKVQKKIFRCESTLLGFSTPETSCHI